MSGLDFDSVVREHQAGLRAFIRALGADEAWVDDLAQEVFIVAYRKQGQFRSEADPGKWLRGIARLVVKGERSKTARRSRLMHAGIADILMNLGQEHEEDGDHLVEILPVMRSCVEALPEPSGNLLRDRYLEGRRALELALETNSTAVAIRKKLQRIRLIVRQCMEAKLKEQSV